MTVYSVFGQAAISPPLQTDTTQETLGMQFTLSQSATLTGIWFYSASGATGLPRECAIYQMTGAGTGSIVSGSDDSAPSWSGAAGSGWVKDTYASGPVLAASTVYKVVVVKDATSKVYSETDNYWSSGPGSGGLTSGIITAPNNAGGDGGQDTFHVGSVITYPAVSFASANYWVDVEVTSGTTVSLGTAPLALAASAITPTAIAPAGVAPLALAALAVTPQVSGAATVNLGTPNLALTAPSVNPQAGSSGGDSWLLMAGIL
jgi:hypothetical protein